MQLDQLQLELRRRSPWEALDLGLVMLRRWRGPVYRVWFATFVPFALLVLLAMWKWPQYSTVVVWWLKPVFDRVLLKVFSEASFGKPPSVREVWRALPGLLRKSSLLSSLTYRRLSPYRSLTLPVWQLEGQQGREARARIKVLKRKVSGHAFWLLFVCAHLVVIFQLGFVSLLEFFAPSNGMPVLDWSELWQSATPEWVAYAYVVAWILAESIIEPFFIAAGFSLYLHRRSELEGWDIEIAFRRMAARHVDVAPGGKSSSSVVALLAGVFCLSLWFTAPSTARADDVPQAQTVSQTAPDDDLLDDEEDAYYDDDEEDEDAAEEEPSPQTPVPAQRPDGKVRQVAENVLRDPVFGEETTEMKWRLRAQENQEEKPSSKTTEFPGTWVEQVAGLLRGLIYVLLFLSAVALIVWAYRHRHMIFSMREGKTPRAVPERLFGLDLSPVALPEDVVRAALAELETAHTVEALSLLFRGTLVALIRDRQVDFRPGDVEGDCLRRIEGRVDEPAALYFARLLDAWKRAAYSDLPPDVARTRELCEQWREHFAHPGVST